MFLHRFVLQPRAGSEYLELLRQAIVGGVFERLDVAQAYATTRGIRALLPAIEPIRDLPKRWMIGIDWCKSEPQALSMLGMLGRSLVRIHGGAEVVARANCDPRIAYHPKTFLLAGKSSIAVITGSGNLSSSGLTKGFEHGSLLLIREPSGSVERELWDSASGVLDWFSYEWKSATPYASIEAAYEAVFQQAVAEPPVTDDDAPDLARNELELVPPARLRRLRIASLLWIQAGGLNPNRGAGRPGSQLDMSAMTSVFFCFPAVRVPPNTQIGSVRLRYGRSMSTETLRFGDNSMEKLNLPVPGTPGGPAKYENETLVFERLIDRRGPFFQLSLATAGQKVSYRATSQRVGGYVRMRSGREWGVL